MHKRKYVPTQISFHFLFYSERHFANYKRLGLLKIGRLLQGKIFGHLSWYFQLIECRVTSSWEDTRITIWIIKVISMSVTFYVSKFKYHNVSLYEVCPLYSEPARLSAMGQCQ